MQRTVNEHSIDGRLRFGSGRAGAPLASIRWRCGRSGGSSARELGDEQGRGEPVGSPDALATPCLALWWGVSKPRGVRVAAAFAALRHRWPPPKGGGGVELVMRILYWSCLSRALCKELARAVDSFLEGWNSRYLNLADAACVPLLMPAVRERVVELVSILVYL
eukprot:COSAG02_NODE_15320_length_1182_cov_0.928901_3_plen_163_part_01